MRRLYLMASLALLFMSALTVPGIAGADYYLKDGMGKAVYMAGYPSVNLVERPGSTEYRNIHSRMQQYGVNKYRVWPLHGWFRYADVVSGSRQIVYNVNSSGKVDLNSFNTRYLSELRDTVADAKSKGIYVQISLFDDCSLEADSTYRWTAHPFNSRNNVNGVFNFGTAADNGSAFYNAGNSTLMHYQRLYVDKILEYTSGYDNVIYEVINEGSSIGGGSGSWDKYWVDYLKARTGRTVAVNHDFTDYNAAGDAGVGLLNFHGYAYPPDFERGSNPDYIRSRVSGYLGIKPQSFDEAPNIDYTVTADQYRYIRRLMWGSLTNGVYFNFHQMKVWEQHSSASMDQNVLNYIKALTDTVKASNFAAGGMVPNRGVVVGRPSGTAHYEALVQSGQSYIVYLSGSTSGGELTLNLPSGTYDARWINPSSGATIQSLALSGSSATRLAAPADDWDAVLLVNRRRRPDE